MRTLDDVGEDVIFGMISSGKGTVPTIDELKVGRRAFYKWLDSADGRRDRYLSARRLFADVLAEETLAIADGAVDAHDAQVRKLRIDTRKWLAGNISPDWRDRKDPTVNITLGDQHLEALRTITVIEHESDEEGD
jgi:hypothetical protein